MRGACVLLAGALIAPLAGCGSSSGSSRSVTLSVLGGTGNQNAVACNKQEAFEQYTSPAQVQYTGNVSPAPSGRWKVKLSLKVCRSGSTVDLSTQKIVGQSSGRFDGTISVAEAGFYSLRAKLEPSGPYSPKVYLQVR